MGAWERELIYETVPCGSATLGPVVLVWSCRAASVQSHLVGLFLVLGRPWEMIDTVPYTVV